MARKNKPEIIKLTRYYEEGVALPWRRVHKVPDYAYFNHSSHVNRGIDCANCHGQVEGMDVVNRIAKVPTGDAGGHQNVPREPVIIESATVITAK